MSKTKGGAKALALAVGFTVLAGGYGLNPVYAADTTSVNINSGSVNCTYDSYSFVGTITNGSATIQNSDIAAALNGQAITGVTSLKVDKVTIDDTTVIVGENGTALADGSLKIGINNTWTSDEGIVASKATFGANTSDRTTIADGVITSSSSENNKTVIDKGTISSKAADTDTNINASFDLNYSGISSKVTNQTQHTDFAQGAQSFSSKVMNGENLLVSQEIAYNQTDGGSIVGTVATVNTVTQNKYGFKVASIATDNNKSAFDFNTTTGIATFTNAAEKTTTIDGDTVTIGSGEKKTVIDGDKITTNTLEVENIVLGGTIKNNKGEESEDGGKLTIRSDGSMSAASGNFTVSKEGAVHSVVGATDAAEGGKTSFETTTTGGTLQFEKADTSTSSVSVSEGSASMKVGDNGVTVTDKQITEKVGDDTNTTTVTTTNSSFAVKGNTYKGFSVDTNSGATTFTGHSETFNGGSATTTVINGNKITTGSITTDQLIITGKGEANGEGTGTITLAGDGSIKSNIKENNKETTFNTDVDGTHTTVTSGGADGNSTSTTKSDVTASGVTTEVTRGENESSQVQQAVDKNESTIKNGDAESTSIQRVDKNETTIKTGEGNNGSSFTQDTTSIGGVVTNGDVSVSQKLDAAGNGSITNTVTGVKDDKTVQSNVVQTTDGLEINDKVDGADEESKNKTLVTATDVSITDTREGRNDERISLSQLGNLNDLDSELSNREEYTSNKTAVGAINAEAQVRREEVARLDRRIDDVNERVDKVGAMAAAIASLKSMGYDPQAPSEFSVGLGQYKGETGVALGFFHYPNKNFMINVSLSTSGGETMGGVGATWRFGYKSPQKLLNEQRAAQAKKELAAAEKYRAAAQLAKEAQERAEYAAKLARQAQVSADNAKAAADATQAKIAD